MDKAPAGALGVYLAPGANAIQTADNVKKILEEAKLRFPPDMQYSITLDSTLPITASMEAIVHTLFEAIILVLIVVYIFLQSFRATIIPMLTVPVALPGVFIAFPMLGFTVNTLTMFGMTISTVIGLFLIPVCYVFVRKFSDRKKKAGPESAPAEPAAHH